MTCEKSVRPVFTVMPPIRKIEEFTANPPRRVQIDTKQNPLQIVDNARLFRQTRGLNRTAVIDGLSLSLGCSKPGTGVKRSADPSGRAAATYICQRAKAGRIAGATHCQ